MSEQSERRPGEGIFAVLLLGLGLFLAWQSWKISGFSALSSPGAFPMAAAAAMVISALVVVMGNRRRPAPSGAESFLTHILPPAVVIFIALLAIYCVFFEALGFLPTSFVFLFVSVWILSRRGVVFSFVIAVCSLAAIYVVFRLIFSVVLPEGLVPEREIMAAIGRMFSGAEVN